MEEAGRRFLGLLCKPMPVSCNKGRPQAASWFLQGGGFHPGGSSNQVHDSLQGSHSGPLPQLST